MTVTIKPVKEPSPDPKIGKPKPKSGVANPYYDLNQSIVVAKKIHEEGGGACTREQLAPLLNYSGVKNGGFLTRISAAKMFGLVEENGQLRITKRAHTILSPVRPEDAERAKVDAFLSVELFRKVYEQFKGTTLPQEAGLRNFLQNTCEIVPDRVIPALRIMMESADAAGFFKQSGNRSRMITPIIIGSTDAATTKDLAPPASPAPGADAPVHRHRHGGGDPPDGIHPAFIGLLRELPAAGTPLPAKKRKALTEAFGGMLNFLYPEEDSGT